MVRDAVTPGLQSQPPDLDALAVVALDLHHLISQLQRPRIATAGWSAAALERCRNLSGRVAAIQAATTSRNRIAGEAVERVTAGLRAYAAELASGPNGRRLQKVGRRLAEDYEILRNELHEFRHAHGVASFNLPHLQPVTWTRGVFHALTGLAAVLMYQFVLTQRQAVLVMGALALGVAAVEVTRRFSMRWNRFLVDNVFGRVIRPWERCRTTSATYYTLALFAIAVLMPRAAAEVGVLALAFGDPAASLIGRRWGVRKLFRDKSWAGTTAFVAASFAATAGFLVLAVPDVGGASLLLLPATVAAVGAGAELFSGRVDDNFTVPVLCSAIATLWFV
jgi:dolichol kinase